MNDSIIKQLTGITPVAIEKYLLLTGWKKDFHRSNIRMIVFRNLSEDEFQIATPANELAPDYYLQLDGLVKMLSDIENVPVQQVIDSMKSSYTDRILFRIITESSKEGKIPLDYAVRCLEGLKDLVLYSACAEYNAKPFCNRITKSAKTHLDSFEFGQTQVGSFIMTVDALVVSEEFEQLYFEEVLPPEPVEHKIVKRIEKAMHQIRSVVNSEVSMGELIESAYESGITANMCDALYKLKPTESEDITLETSIHYAAAITRSVSSKYTIEFNDVHFEILDEVSKRYKDCTLVQDISVEGTIKMLSKEVDEESDELSNTVRLQAKIDGKSRSIILHLPPDKHILACNAYRDDKFVEVEGTIDKSSRRWIFSEITSFVVVD